MKNETIANMVFYGMIIIIFLFSIGIVSAFNNVSTFPSNLNLFDYFYTTDNAINFDGTANNWILIQSFKGDYTGTNDTGRNYTLKGINVQLGGSGTAARIRFTVTNASGETQCETNQTIAYGESDLMNFYAGYTRYNWTFWENYSYIENGKYYCIILNCSYGSIQWRVDTAGSGNRLLFGQGKTSAGSWAANRDFDFQLWGENWTAPAPPVASSINTTIATYPNGTFLSKPKNFSFNSTATFENGNFTNATLYIWNDTTTNTLFSAIAGYDNYSFKNQSYYLNADGTYYWNVLYCGLNVTQKAVCSFDEENRTIKIHTTYPTVAIVNPLNTSYNYAVINNSIPNTTINFTLSTPYPSSCWYYNDSANVSITCGNNVTLNLGEGGHTIRFYANDSYNLSSFTSLSFTNVFATNIRSILFNASTYETAYETFTLNVSYNPLQYSNILASLNYDGTVYNMVQNNVGSNAIFNLSFDIPLVATDGEKNPFYFTIGLLNSTGITYLNTSFYNQTIGQIFLRSCDATYTILSLNFTAYYEKNLTRINPFDYFSSYDYYLGTGSIKKNGTINNASTEFVEMCIKPVDKTYHYSSLISYTYQGNTTYQPRDYFFNDFLINNITNNISLFLLEVNDVTSFIIKVEDINQLAIPNAYVYIQRYYPETDSYQTVQVVKTDDTGKTIGFYKTETVYYRHIIVINSQTVLTTSKQKIFGETLPYTLTFTIGQGLGDILSNLASLTDLSSSLTFNSSTKMLSFLYVDSSGIFNSSRLRVDINHFNNTNENYCNTTSLLSNNVLTCNLSSFASENFIAYGYITRNGHEYNVQLINFNTEDTTNIFGMFGLFMAFILILCLSMIFIYNQIAGIWLTTIGLIFMNLIGIVNFGTIFNYAIFFIAVILTFIFNKNGQ